MNLTKKSFANAVRRTTKTKIKKILIKDWLKHYNLEEFLFPVFKINFQKRVNNTLINCENNSLLKSIDNNIDLLFSFKDLEHFILVIEERVHVYLYDLSLNGKIPQWDFFDIKNKFLKRFIEAFKLLNSQKIEFKQLQSVFGLKPDTKKYLEVLDSKILNFLDKDVYIDKGIFKNIILQKLKILNFEDLLHCDPNIFNIILSIPIDLLEVFCFYTTHKMVEIKKGLKKSFSKKKFNSFIDKNTSLDVFESCDNLFNLKMIKKNLKENFTAETFLDIHRILILPYLINTTKKIDDLISTQILSLFFPNNNSIYLSKQFNKIDLFIPKNPLTSKLVKEEKVRVFVIQGHGGSCSLKSYSKQKRVDLDKVLRNIMVNLRWRKNIGITSPKLPPTSNGDIKEYDLKNITFLSTQSLGRLTLLNYLSHFIKLFGDEYRDIFIRGILDSNEKKHMDLLNILFTMFLGYNQSEYKSTNKPSDFEIDFNKYLAGIIPEKWKIGYFKYTKTEETDRNLVNFVKYNKDYPPINNEFIFKPHNLENEDMYGLFELTSDDSLDLLNLNKHIILKKSADFKLKMGLADTDKIFNFRDDIPKNMDKIIKYNTELLYTTTTAPKWKLENLVEIIYENGNIQYDEKVIIISNTCRGLHDPTFAHRSGPITEGNRFFQFRTRENRNKITQLRKKSRNGTQTKKKKVSGSK